VRADAKRRGLKKLMSIEIRENRDTIDLERRKGFTARGLDGDPALLVPETAL
jgi:acetyltransferase